MNANKNNIIPSIININAAGINTIEKTPVIAIIAPTITIIPEVEPVLPRADRFIERIDFFLLAILFPHLININPP